MEHCDGHFAGIAPAPGFFSIWPPVAAACTQGARLGGSRRGLRRSGHWRARCSTQARNFKRAASSKCAASRPSPPARGRGQDAPGSRHVRWGAALAEACTRGRSGQVAGRSRPTPGRNPDLAQLACQCNVAGEARGHSLTPSWGKPGLGLDPAAGAQCGRAMAPCCHGTRARGYVRVHRAGGGGGLWLAGCQ